MNDDAEEAARRERAARRRATWGPGEWVPLGTPKPSMLDEVAPAQRLGHLWALTCRAWAMAGKEVRRLPRREWPVETFEIIDGRPQPRG